MSDQIKCVHLYVDCLEYGKKKIYDVVLFHTLCRFHNQSTVVSCDIFLLNFLLKNLLHSFADEQ